VNDPVTTVMPTNLVTTRHSVQRKRGQGHLEQVKMDAGWEELERMANAASATGAQIASQYPSLTKGGLYVLDEEFRPIVLFSRSELMKNDILVGTGLDYIFSRIDIILRILPTLFTFFRHAAYENLTHSPN
jgi:hypothetical protein